jgi:hypothetical protein
VVHHYGDRPEFVVLGGLVPELLCSGSEFRHAGTIDVDVQFDLEITGGSVNARRLERSLRNAEFEPDGGCVWRWTDAAANMKTIVEFELLADLDDVRSHDIAVFRECDELGAVNLRGMGFAARDFEPRALRARIGGGEHVVEVDVTGLAGYLLAKIAAARSRRKPKDW